MNVPPSQGLDLSATSTPFPSPEPSKQTPKDQLETQLRHLRQNATSWVCLPIQDRLDLVQGMVARLKDLAPQFIQPTLPPKKLEPTDTSWIAAEWLSGPVLMVRSLRILAETLMAFRDHGSSASLARFDPPTPLLPYRAQVLGRHPLEKWLFLGYRGEIWFRPETQPGQQPRVPPLYQGTLDQGKVALILGGGNQASIPFLDVIQKLFMEGQVCLLKMHPVNDKLGPAFETLFEAFIRAGFVEIAYGGISVGAYLCEHPGIDEIHITGSSTTHDIIVFGAGPDGAPPATAPKGKPRLNKRITSELGNVSPVIVLPGLWTKHQLRYQAEHLASQLTENAGFNCNAARVIITHRSWPQRTRFLDELRKALNQIPPRFAYYPGATERYAEFIQAHPGAEPLGGHPASHHLPWTLMADLDPKNVGDLCFTREAFCSVLAETALPAPTAGTFLIQAVEFCNTVLWGTLNACLIVHPRTQAELGDQFLTALRNLKYGCVGVNVWPAVGFAMAELPWGAYPGNALNDVGSGIGVVHNLRFFENIEKGVLFAPFTQFPKPVWFYTNKVRYPTIQAFFEFEQDPTFWRLLKVMWKGVFG
jgi:hypothetical protein